MSGVPEANIQVELYRVLRNLIELGKGKFKSLEFTDVKTIETLINEKASLLAKLLRNEISF